MNQLVSPTTQALKIYRQREGQMVLPITDLMFLRATGNYSWLHWKNGQRILLPRTLKYYEPQLPSGWFVRAHRNCIVNVRYIERIEFLYPDKGGLVHLHSGDVLPVSRRRWVAIKKIFQRLLLTDRYVQTGRA
ncbi:LytR/AlgR family response regulator transcription factor [Spirosoma validum]|uniref:LytTR family transcriptional regulator n=1 Tax=Spirosoma validum TaxID=2771355 RepID=A0A927GGX0_9BACT|nr:LytTR family DNA-binding domain-containing protein [Spirosoma validum]MBD2757432.1 LytTR family transcriptional regulator [Spirosoma validum]